MDLPDLLDPERIRCRCDLHSKKRALQTVAELLGASLRARAADPGAGASAGDGAADEGDADGAGPTGERASSAAKARVRRAERGERRDDGAEAGQAPEISDMDILDALIGRERLGSTGLGHGVALPHSRLDTVDSPLAALITLNDGVDFESADGEPVDLVLGLLVPRDCNDEHLEILAKLARRFSDAELRERLREAKDGEALFDELARLAADSDAR